MHKGEGKSIDNARYSLQRSHVPRGSVVFVLYSKGYRKSLVIWLKSTYR